MDTQLGIIRSGGTLTAQRVRQTVFPDFESREAVAEALAAPAPWYEIVDTPQAAGPLLSAWKALGGRRRTGGKLLQTVLAETVLGTPMACRRVTSAARARNRSAPKQRRRILGRTAGTKYKPPTPKTPLPLDLRPLLCGTGRVEGLTAEQEAARAAEARLPEGFRTTLYLLLRGLGGNTAETLALYWALELENNPARLAAVAMLLVRQTGLLGRDWATLAATQPDEWRTPFLYLLLASGADAVAVPTSLGRTAHRSLRRAGPGLPGVLAPARADDWDSAGVSAGRISAGIMPIVSTHRSYSFHNVTAEAVSSPKTLCGGRSANYLAEG